MTLYWQELRLLLAGPRLPRALGDLGLAALWGLVLAVVITWPTARHMGEIVLGGGELGGWMWRTWWHATEVAALAEMDDVALPERLLALVSLGRYPETGNILDILLLSIPLEALAGFPQGHNLKVLVILWGNAVCGWVLARSLTDSRGVAAAAAALAVYNPLVLQDVDRTGLRQVLLWWMLLFPVFFQRAARSAHALDGALLGVVFTLVSASYWFYGLFTGLLSVFLLGGHLVAARPSARALLGWAAPAAAVALAGVGFFVSPYLSTGAEDAGQGGVERLPELSFFLPFPAYDTLAETPTRPSNYRENVLASLHRTIESAWPGDTLWNLFHGPEGWPVVLLALGLLPALRLRAARPWALAFAFFYLGTLGPWLKLGALKDAGEVATWGGDTVLRLPFTLYFQFIPGMARMFAPYRLASGVVVCGIVLLALGLGGFTGARRTALVTLFLTGLGLQTFLRVNLDKAERDENGLLVWRLPTEVIAIRVPAFYRSLDPKGWEGIIELPLDQQQDLLCAYQVTHQRKVYRSWATEPAIPPMLRKQGGGTHGRRLRWLAKNEPNRDAAEPVFRALSRPGLDADASALTDKALAKLMEAGNYRYLVVHERGYHLSEPRDAAAVYHGVVAALERRLGLVAGREIEHEDFTWPGQRRGLPPGPAWVSGGAEGRMSPNAVGPTRYEMAVFDLSAWSGAPQPAEAAATGTPAAPPGEPIPAPPAAAPAPENPPPPVPAPAAPSGAP